MVRRQQAADRAIRPKLRSPGHPKYQRHVEVAFWGQIVRGLLAEEAAGVVGVAPAVGTRWFHNAGGMSPFDLKFQPSGRYLSFAEREEIALLKAQDKGVREIARAIGRDPGTISRELRRNAATRGGKPQYRASVAQCESRHERTSAQDREAGRQAATAHLCTGAVVWADQPTRWHHHRRAAAAEVHWAEQASPQGPAVVASVEPRADRQPAQSRLPRGRFHAYQPRGDLPVALHPGPWRA